MESLRKIWDITVEVWNQGFLGIDLGRILGALGILLGFLLIRRVFTNIVINRLSAVAERSRTQMDNRAIEALRHPISFIPVVLGLFFATDYLELSGSIQLIAERLVRSLIVFLIFWSLYRVVEPMSQLIRRLEKILTTPLVEWLIKATHVAFVLIGAATILEIWGIQVAPILAGLGLLGVAVALGAQDLFKNLIAGILIIAESRFHPGDWIRVDGEVEGTVESIGFRSTRVRRFDKAPVHVPNAKLSDNSVINFSAMSHRRIYWLIAVEYRTTIAQLRHIRDGIERFILDSNDFAQPPEVPAFVRIDRFSDSSIDVMVYCFTRTTVWGEWLEIKERLAYRIKELVEGSGTGFAFPSQSVYIEKIPGERAEIYIPPEGGTVHPSRPRSRGDGSGNTPLPEPTAG